jgi:hypothetical protein
VAYPFLPMTDEILKKLTRMVQDSILTAKLSEPRFVFSIPKTRPIEELNPQNTETNHSQLPH